MDGRIRSWTGVVHVSIGYEGREDGRIGYKKRP